MNIEIGKTALVTTDVWFFAPDGKQYRAVFGTVKGCFSAEEVLGIKTNARSTNWYLEIGNMTVAGCQIQYAIRTDNYNKLSAEGWSTSAADGLKAYRLPCAVYCAD